MIKFTPSIPDDEPQILEWVKKDPYHCKNVDVILPGWWITGSDCLVAGCIEDESGPTMYFRFDWEGEFVRFHVQFAPLNEVNKLRMARAMLEAMPALIIMVKEKKAKGIVFESISPSLIRFMGRLGFKQSKILNDYVLDFEEM